MATAATNAQYSAIVLGATGNVGGRIVQLLPAALEDSAPREATVKILEYKQMEPFFLR